MVSMEKSRLVFRFPEVHEEAVLGVNFQRTLRIPDDHREYPLPPGLGRFPLDHVDDHAGRVPERWLQHGGVLLPMYQAEAMWIAFEAREYPFAVKVAAGKVNAVTGGAWDRELHALPQDYVVTPRQPWLDGFAVKKGVIRQFVAMPLGRGYTAEEQLTGEAEHGGLQICVYPMKAAVYERLRRPRMHSINASMVDACCAEIRSEMGLAPGGLMRQEVYDDPHGLKAWETAASGRCFVHIVNSAEYERITGRKPPTKPPTAEAYTRAGLPWFSYYDETARALDGAPSLAGLDSVAALGWKKGEQPLEDNGPVAPQKVVPLGPVQGKVREGEF